MDNWPHLNRAPIVEGLIDIRVEPSPIATLDALRSCADELASEFPSREELRTFMSEFSFSPEIGPSLTSHAPAPTGLLLRSADGKWVAQFRLDGFTLSRLEPYTSWNDLKDRAKELWTKYRTVAQPRTIVRVAARFINRIPLPPKESFENTFTTTFTIAATLPQAVTGFLLRVVVPFEDQGVLAIVTQALPENSQDCTFDLDVFAAFTEWISDSEAWSKIEQLRSVKNRLFFESLTTGTLEKFK